MFKVRLCGIQRRAFKRCASNADHCPGPGVLLRGGAMGSRNPFFVHAHRQATPGAGAPAAGPRGRKKVLYSPPCLPDPRFVGRRALALSDEFGEREAPSELIFYAGVVDETNRHEVVVWCVGAACFLLQGWRSAAPRCTGIKRRAVRPLVLPVSRRCFSGNAFVSQGDDGGRGSARCVPAPANRLDLGEPWKCGRGGGEIPSLSCVIWREDGAFLDGKALCDGEVKLCFRMLP